MRKRRFPFCTDIMAMYYCWKDKTTSIWVKLLLTAAIIYLLFPFDAIPDLIPVTGLLDDLGLVTIALSFLRRKVSAEHWEKAGEKCG